MPLHIGCAEGDENWRRPRRKKAGLRLQAITPVPLERASTGQMRTLPHDLREEGVVRQQGLRELVPSEVLGAGGLRDVEAGRTARPPTHEEVEDEKPPAGMAAKPPIVETE